MALGVNMAPKSFQNGARGGDEIAPCFQAWTGLGGVLGFQERARADFNRCSMIFDEFWLIFGLFFDDFSMTSVMVVILV